MAKLKFNTGDARRDRILGAIAEMKYKDLQGEVIQRDMPFDEVVEGTFPSLSTWLILHWDTPKNKDLLKGFDKWVDKQLKAKGYKKSNPVRQYKKFDTEYNSQDPKLLPPPKPKEIKPPKEKKKKSQQFGIFEGTKKDYTYKLADKVYTQFFPKYKDTRILLKKFREQLCIKVRKKFPEANDKSVTIWMKRAIDQVHDKQSKTQKD